MNRNQSRKTGYIFGIGLSSLVLLTLSSSLTDAFHSPGPMNPGHKEMPCQECHQLASGTIRQQLQADLRYTFKQRGSPVSVGRKEVGNRDCIRCHTRDNERHPVHRFLEPRFTKVRGEIKPHFCSSCHREHSGQRVSAEIEFCQSCHDELSLRNDPLDIPHETLVRQRQWSSCLGCHDFHGNHKMKVPTNSELAITPQDILSYFDHGTSPYPDERYFEATQWSNDEQ